MIYLYSSSWSRVMTNHPENRVMLHSSWSRAKTNSASSRAMKFPPSAESCQEALGLATLYLLMIYIINKTIIIAFLHTGFWLCLKMCSKHKVLRFWNGPIRSKIAACVGWLDSAWPRGTFINGVNVVLLKINSRLLKYKCFFIAFIGSTFDYTNRGVRVR